MTNPDPQTRVEKRRVYMRDLMRKRRALQRANAEAAKSAGTVSTPVSSPVSTPAANAPAPVSRLVSTPVSSADHDPALGRSTASSRAPDRPTVIFRPVVHKPTGLTPMVRAQAKKVYNLLVNGRSLGERSAARQRLQEIVQKAGVPAADLMAAIGAPPDALEAPVV